MPYESDVTFCTFLVSVSLGDNDATARVEAVTLAKDVGFSPRKSCRFRG